MRDRSGMEGRGHIASSWAQLGTETDLSERYRLGWIGWTVGCYAITIIVSFLHGLHPQIPKDKGEPKNMNCLSLVVRMECLGWPEALAICMPLVKAACRKHQGELDELDKNNEREKSVRECSPYYDLRRGLRVLLSQARADAARKAGRWGEVWAQKQGWQLFGRCVERTFAGCGTEHGCRASVVGVACREGGVRSYHSLSPAHAFSLGSVGSGTSRVFLRAMRCSAIHVCVLCELGGG